MVESEEVPVEYGQQQGEGEEGLLGTADFSTKSSLYLATRLRHSAPDMVEAKVGCTARV